MLWQALRRNAEYREAFEKFRALALGENYGLQQNPPFDATLFGPPPPINPTRSILEEVSRSEENPVMDFDERGPLQSADVDTNYRLRVEARKVEIEVYYGLVRSPPSPINPQEGLQIGKPFVLEFLRRWGHILAFPIDPSVVHPRVEVLEGLWNLRPARLLTRFEAQTLELLSAADSKRMATVRLRPEHQDVTYEAEYPPGHLLPKASTPVWLLSVGNDLVAINKLFSVNQAIDALHSVVDGYETRDAAEAEIRAHCLDAAELSRLKPRWDEWRANFAVYDICDKDRRAGRYKRAGKTWLEIATEAGLTAADLSLPTNAQRRAVQARRLIQILGPRS